MQILLVAMMKCGIEPLNGTNLVSFFLHEMQAAAQVAL